MKCHICNSKKFKKIITKNGYDVHECVRCGLFFVYPQPSFEDLKKIYSKENDYGRSTTQVDKNPSKLSNEKIAYLISKGKKKILDVGCGVGNFIYAANKKGLKAQGIELAEDLVNIGKKEGLNISVGDLNHAKYRKNTFDAINLSEIIEHVKDPRELLKKSNDLLKKRGILFINTPNAGAFFPRATLALYKLFGLTWSHATPPHHLFDFSKKNLIILLNQEGFKVKKVTYQNTSIGYSIYKTGYFGDIRDSMKNLSKKELLKSLIFKHPQKIIPFILVSSIYGGLYAMGKAIQKITGVNDGIIIYAQKK